MIPRGYDYLLIQLYLSIIAIVIRLSSYCEEFFYDGYYYIIVVFDFFFKKII